MFARIALVGLISVIGDICACSQIVVVSELELLCNTDQGKKVLQEVDQFTVKIMNIVEQEKQLVLQQEARYISLQEMYKSSKNNISEREILQIEQEVEEARAIFEGKKVEAQQHIENHYKAMAAKFCKEVCCRYQTKYNFDIAVFASLESLAFFANKVDITSVLLQELHKEIVIRSKKYSTKEEIQQLFSDLDLVYLEKNNIDSSFVKLLDTYQKEYYALYPEISNHLFQKYSLAIEKKHRAPVYVSWISDVVGWGLFAAADIFQGDLIQEYVGVLIDDLDGARDMSYAWNILKVPGRNLLFIDPRQQGNEMRFVNHSDIPNVEPQLVLGRDGRYHLCYVAKKDIKKDQQLLVNYGPLYWKSNAHIEPLTTS